MKLKSEEWQLALTYSILKRNSKSWVAFSHSEIIFVFEAKMYMHRVQWSSKYRF